VSTYGKLQQGKGSRPIVVPPRKVKQFTLAVRDPDCPLPPMPADSEVAAQLAAAAAARAVADFAELPPTNTALLSSTRW
jgi:hypothetical protein